MQTLTSALEERLYGIGMTHSAIFEKPDIAAITSAPSDPALEPVSEVAEELIIEEDEDIYFPGEQEET